MSDRFTWKPGDLQPVDDDQDPEQEPDGEDAPPRSPEDTEESA